MMVKMQVLTEAQEASRVENQKIREEYKKVFGVSEAENQKLQAAILSKIEKGAWHNFCESAENPWGSQQKNY